MRVKNLQGTKNIVTETGQGKTLILPIYFEEEKWGRNKQTNLVLGFAIFIPKNLSGW